MQNVVCKIHVTGQRKVELISSPFSWMVSSRKLRSFHAASVVHLLYWFHCTEPDHTPGHFIEMLWPMALKCWATGNPGMFLRILRKCSLRFHPWWNSYAFISPLPIARNSQHIVLKVWSWMHFTFRPFVMSFSSSSLLFPKVWLFFWNKQKNPI